MRLVYEPILPNEYTRLEYLESTGTQYIDTGIKFLGDGYSIKTKFDNSNTPDNTTVIGYQLNLNTNAVQILVIGHVNESTTGSLFWNGTQTPHANRNKANVTQKGLNELSITADNGTLTYTLNDASPVSYQTYTLFSPETDSLWMFGNSRTGTGSTFEIQHQLSTVKIYNLVIKQNDTLVRDFIPALRNSDNKPGMYDKVSGTFYTNAGTGEFKYQVGEEENIVDNPRYQQVEYIESTGSQYIDTGFIPNQDTRIISEFEYTKDPGNKGFIFGAGYSATDRAFELYPWTNNWNSPYGNTNIIFGTSVSLLTSGKIYSDKNKNTILIRYSDGTEQTGQTDYTEFNVPDRNIWLFSINRGSTTFLADCVRLYSCKIYDNGKLTRNFIPVIRKIDNKPGMYDKITKQFYTNVGTGEDFLYGEKVYNVLPSKYEKLEYLESTGTQYIDTGFIPTDDNFKFEIKMFSPNTSAYLGYRSVNSGTASGDMRWFFNYSDGRVAIRYGNTTENSTLSFDTQTTHKFYFNGSSLYVDDVNYLTTTKKYTTPVYKSFYLFSVNANGYYSADIAKFVGRIYYTKIWDNDTLVRYFQPALRKADNKPGMYDFITGQFFTNLGTGEFTYDYPAKSLSNSKLRLIKTGGYTIYDDLYKEVEYLQSTGTQYIDTGVYPTQLTEVEYRCAVIGSVANADSHLFGSRLSASSEAFDFAYMNTQPNGIEKFRFIHGTTTSQETTTSVTASQLASPHTYYMSGTSFKVDGSVKMSFTTTSFTGTYSLWLFGVNSAGSLHNQVRAQRVYKCPIWDNGVLIRDFVPVIRITDNKPGMYDKKNKVFYTNVGTGEFTYPTPTLTKPLVTRFVAGGYVASIYKPLQYLESSGTQYIDIGIKGDLNTKAEILYRYPSASSVSGSGRVMGSRTGASSNGFGIGTSSGSIIVNEGVGAYFSNANIGTATITKVAVNTWYQTILSQDGVYFNGTKEELINGSVTTFTTPNNLKLFGFDNNGTMGYGKVQISKFKLWSNGALVRDFVPVLRTLDNKPGMYDRVNGVFYTNSGTGEFSYA